MADKNDHDYDNSIYQHTGVFVPAGLLIGIGVGLLVGHVGAWTLIGLGAGFLAMALLGSVKHKR